VVLPEESLLKYVFSDSSEARSSGAAVVTMRGTAADEELGNDGSMDSGLAGTRLDLELAASGGDGSGLLGV